jgi:4-amino-4-deoxy-L-arabinose transferase-like glycosyltransferase
MRQPTLKSGSRSQALLAMLSGPTILPLLIFAWLAATAWVRPLSLPDEGRYVGVALEMLWSGDWLVPTLDTLPYFHKPPLFYWATAASLATFGIHEWAARVPSLMAASGCALGIFYFLRRWTDDAQAGIALLALATTPLFYGGAQFANLDMLVTACIAGTILCAAHAVLATDDASPQRAALAAAYIFAALGVLAKGLIGVVIPAIVIGAWLAITARPRMILRLVWLPGLVLSGLIAAPWFLLMQMRYPGFFHYFFVHHHFERYAAQGFNNARPFWFIVAAFAGATLPWCLSLAGTARTTAAAMACGPSKNVRALMWTWLIATLVFFSIPKSKLIGYVMVAAPPLAVLAADAITRVAGEAGRARVWATRLAVLGVLIGAVMMVYVMRHDHSRDNTSELAAGLQSLKSSPADAVVAMSHYPFSLAFYLGHSQPIRVVEDWGQSWVTQKDTWRRELFEAAEFAPDRGKRLLLTPDAMRLLLACSPRTVWLITSGLNAPTIPQLAGLERVAQVGNEIVWRKTPSSAAAPHPDCFP